MHFYTILKLCVDLEGPSIYCTNVLGSLMCGMAVGKHPLSYHEPRRGLLPPDPPIWVGGIPPPLCNAQFKDNRAVCETSLGVGVVIRKCWRSGC